MESEGSLLQSQVPAILSQIGPVHISLSHFLKIHFNITLAFMSVTISGIVGMDWINLAQDGDRSRDLVDAAMNLRVP